METENGKAYMLTSEERGVMEMLRSNVLIAKSDAWDAQQKLTAAQRAFDGGLGMLANSRGFGGGELTADLSAIVKHT